MEHRGPGKPVTRPPALGPLVIESSPGPIASEPISIHRGPARKVARGPALGEIVIESAPAPIASEPVSIHRGPGRRVARGPEWNSPRPPLADVYDDDPPRAA